MFVDKACPPLYQHEQEIKAEQVAMTLSSSSDGTQATGTALVSGSAKAKNPIAEVLASWTGHSPRHSSRRTDPREG